jgi:hypothetical protein
MATEKGAQAFLSLVVGTVGTLLACTESGSKVAKAVGKIIVEANEASRLRQLTIAEARAAHLRQIADTELAIAKAKYDGNSTEVWKQSIHLDELNRTLELVYS